MRKKFASVQAPWSKMRTIPETLEQLIAGFKSLTEQFHPVMRHFFTEYQRVPISWFTMRLNYTRSVASSSIIGHVLGLGDRHTSNILMDNGTGDVVHIDLGIAFEQVNFEQYLSASSFTETVSIGKAASRARTSAIPVDEGYDRWHGVLWNTRCFSAMR